MDVSNNFLVAPSSRGHSPHSVALESEKGDKDNFLQTEQGRFAYLACIVFQPQVILMCKRKCSCGRRLS